MVSKHLSSCNLYQFKNFPENQFWYLVMPTGWNIEDTVMKLFINNFLLLDIYTVEGFLNQHKNDEMVNNYSNRCN